MVNMQKKKTHTRLGIQQSKLLDIKNKEKNPQRSEIKKAQRTHTERNININYEQFLISNN